MTVTATKDESEKCRENIGDEEQYSDDSICVRIDRNKLST
jgi:hypothetical protein